MSRVYDLRRWRKVRLMFLSTNPLCIDCDARGIKTLATEVDHIVPISKGGDAFDADNFAPRCKSCHSEKTAVDTGKRKVRKGCDIHGIPTDPAHWWNKE